MLANVFDKLFLGISLEGSPWNLHPGLEETSAEKLKMLVEGLMCALEKSLCR